MSDKDSIQTNRSRRNFLKGATGAVVAGVGASAFFRCSTSSRTEN